MCSQQACVAKAAVRNIFSHDLSVTRDFRYVRRNMSAGAVILNVGLTAHAEQSDFETDRKHRFD